jgi:hypothetical protein
MPIRTITSVPRRSGRWLELSRDSRLTINISLLDTIFEQSAYPLFFKAFKLIPGMHESTRVCPGREMRRQAVGKARSKSETYTRSGCVGPCTMVVSETI